VHTLCQALQVSRSGFYNWLNSSGAEKPEQMQEALVVKLF
jgi:hypothetical protein